MIRRVVVIFALSLLLLGAGRGGFYLSPLDRATAPHRWAVITWEFTHLPDKWTHRVLDVLPWRHEDKSLRALKEFFQIGEEIDRLEREAALARPSASVSPDWPGGPMARLRELYRRQADLRPGVEERLESLVSAILAREGFDSRIGLIFPPVDVALLRPPTALVLSPRERIERLDTVLLSPNLRGEEMGALEDRVFREEGKSALVVDLGGIATYPSIVPSRSGLLFALTTASHEWLHQYFFFRPLGRHYNSSPDMNTLNESAAELAGRELGEMVYEWVTGEKVQHTRGPIGAPAPRFDFNREMRQTRLRVDELLAQRDVVGAERYMEERRQVFVSEGYYIRRLNQAYFAFYGSYGDNPASVSPVQGQLEQLRASFRSVGDFIRQVSHFGSYEQFKAYLKKPQLQKVPPAQ